MTLKDAVLKTLEELGKLVTHNDVYGHVINKSYYDFGLAKTPASTVSALLGDFIRNGDSRVKRVSTGKGNFSYYLSKYEEYIFPATGNSNQVLQLASQKQSTYSERSLHTLFSTYLKSTNTSSKTIYHEQSANSKDSKDSNQKWIHPDMVGVEFTNLHTKTSQSFGGGLLRGVYRKHSRWFILSTIASNVAASRFGATAAKTGSPNTNALLAATKAYSCRRRCAKRRSMRRSMPCWWSAIRNVALPARRVWRG